MIVTAQDYPFLSTFASNYQRIYEEYLGIRDSIQQWPQRNLQVKGSWDVYGITDYEGNPIEGAFDRAPFTTQLILDHLPNRRSTGFSRLQANTVLKPHRGIYPCTWYRAHVGLSVPEGDVALHVLEPEPTLMRFVEGGVWAFDDSLEHEAWNKTDKERVTLLMDFDK